ncbi:MAG: hypothetical protein ACRCTI_06740 [Beijerinckiaceae bacterium]
MFGGGCGCYTLSPMNGKNLITIVSLAILVGAEILGAALALGWAIGSMYELSDTWRYGVIGVCLAAGAYTIFRFMQNAVKLEPISSRK